MVLVVFRSRLRPGHSEEYARLADEMSAIAESLPGFISEKTFTAEDGERVSVQEWASLEAIRKWRDHPDHLRAQHLGRTKFYAEYTLWVSEAPREIRHASSSSTF